MKKLKRNELFRNFTAFLAGKGIELKDGAATETIRRGCDLLTDAVNLAQGGLVKARTEVNTKVDHLRKVIHEKTAPKPAASKPTPPAAAKRARVRPAAAAKPARGKNGRPASK